MNELPDDVKALLQRGDPARGVSPQLVARVSERLETRVAMQGRWQGAVLVAALAASVALGAAGTVVVSRWAPGVLAPSPRPAPPASTPRRSTEDAVTKEAALVQAALEALARGASDEALAKLDERDRTFPAGPLAAEARVARVRVLLARGEADAALERLAALPPSDVTPALRSTWVQVLVKRERCEAAREVARALDSAAASSALGPCAVKGGP
ncbi:MAG: hypothetical protein MUC96_04220 [Myxococcaceae bacterium]|jgi:hypothetical protein|nr:hypothetical protein [Myxococcaceae bacterium]